MCALSEEMHCPTGIQLLVC